MNDACICNYNRVLFDLSLIRASFILLDPNERDADFISNLVDRYTRAVSLIEDVILHRVFELLYLQGLSREECAARMNCDRRTIYRYNQSLVSLLCSLNV